MPSSTQQQYSDTLKQLVGRVLSIKPNTPPTLAADFLNDAVRVISDRKPMWTGSIDYVPIGIPAIYNTGSVDMTANNRAVLNGTGAWPTNDAVNTTIPSGITRLGLQTVVPASMTGITVDTALYVASAPLDAGAEIVYVKSVTSTSFQASFTRFQNVNVTITSSSFVGRQFRAGGRTKPIFNIQAVPTATTLILDNLWRGSSEAGMGYEIWQSLYTLDPAIKAIISLMDPTQGIPPIKTNVPAGYLDTIDPQRTATGYPQVMAPRGPDINGNMQYELWPQTQSARQLILRFYRQPPKMMNDGDYAPFTLNPTLLFMYAASMALRAKIGVDDPYYSPSDSMAYMKMFEDQYNAMCLAEDAKNHTDGSWQIGTGMPGGADWQRNHSYDAWSGNF